MEQHLSPHHERVRRRGVNRPVYWAIRAVVQPAIQLYFRLRRTGRAHIPEGGVILASNHRSFLDPFVIGLCLRRPVYFVAKRELFQYRLVGRLLNALGAFPIERGASDQQSLATARAPLERGEAVVIFPEGTRVRQLIRPVRVHVRRGRPLTYPAVQRPSRRLAAEVTARVWPCVELQW